MHSLIQRLEPQDVMFEDLNLPTLIATIVTMCGQPGGENIQLTVIAHGKVKPDEGS